MARDLKKLLDSFKQSSYYQRSEASKTTPHKNQYSEEEQPTERSERAHRIGPPSQSTDNRYQTEEKYNYNTGRTLLRGEFKRQEVRETEEKFIEPKFTKQMTDNDLNFRFEVQDAEPHYIDNESDRPDVEGSEDRDSVRSYREEKPGVQHEYRFMGRPQRTGRAAI